MNGWKGIWIDALDIDLNLNNDSRLNLKKLLPEIIVQKQ